MNKEELENLILVKKLSYEEIGKREGISGAGIKKRAKKLGIPLPQRRNINPSEWKSFSHLKHADNICPICGKSFRPSQWKVITCSKDCASKYKSLINKKEKPIWDGIEKKNMWNYSQIVDNNGYLYAMCPQHPKSLSTGYVYLHRLIVENYLGRILKDDEVIHHKDFNRKNNSIENLLVLSQSEHSKLHWNLRKGI